MARLSAGWSIGCALLLLGWGAVASAFEIEQIRVEGLQKIAPGTVFTYLPVSVGDDLLPSDSPRLIHALFDTGFFHTVELYREGNTLLVQVVERPTLSEITLEGNKVIDDDSMKESLAAIGIAPGKIFNRSHLEKMQLELQQLYFSRGKYAVKMDFEVRQLSKNRVAIDINVSEGIPARIRSINITGNQDFDDETLRKEFKSDDEGGWFSDADTYSRPKLSADMEALRSFYMDRGYLDFDLASTQVSISPDKKDIHVAINIDEGEIYRIESLTVGGDLVVPEAELMALVTLQPGDIFSRKTVAKIIQQLEKRIADEGFAFARINALPEVNETERTVSIQFLVDPGQRVMVREIRFEGNYSTRDIVLRREMRQLEGATYSQALVDRSKVRLQRLRFIGVANARTLRVPGHPDQVDLVFSVSERFSGSFNVGVGYSEGQGALFNMSLTHDNVFGTGKSLGIQFDNSESRERYSLKYKNPYYTESGISRGMGFSYTTTDAAQEAISNYILDALSASVDYTVPLSEYNALRYSVGAERNKLQTSDSTATEITDFIIANDDSLSSGASVYTAAYDTVFASIGFSKDTRNRTIFADQGYLHSVSLELFNGDLDYYKFYYRNQWVTPVTGDISFSLRSQLSYGDALSDTSDLPFYEKYYAGGIRTVRGYDVSSLGPRDSQNRPFGGNLQTVAHAEFLLPYEPLGGRDIFRLGLFFDIGNVFADTDAFDSDELRSSYGVSTKWYSPVGPIEFSYAEAINNKPGDDLQSFQFSLGAQF